MESVSRMLAYCGIACDKCPAYLATINCDEELSRRTAAKWTETIGRPIAPEDIRCLGCKSNVLMKLCHECPMRDCALGRGLETCGHCKDYICSTLERFLRQMPAERETLDRIHLSTRKRQDSD